MSIVCANDHGWVVDHALYIHKVYQSTHVNRKIWVDWNDGCIIQAEDKNGDSRSLSLRSELFSIHHPFMTELQFQKYKLKNTAETMGHELEPGSQKVCEIEAFSHKFVDHSITGSFQFFISKTFIFLLQKRRKRKLPLNDGEKDLIHFHEEVNLSV